MKKSISLSKIVLALSLCYSSVQFSYADIQANNGNTQIYHQKGVEVVNIATPTSSGLSHNQYQKYNVDKSGAVLNNAQSQTSSQLAGSIAANPHLKQQSATVILNEVVSRNPSILAGKQEIVGQRADYVLANPNGISCDGCGFINTPRASLVVGKATVDTGKLTGYDVNGDKALTSKNLSSTDTDVDLIAPTVNVSGKTQAKNLNVILGQNTIKRADNGDLSLTVQQQKGQVLDGKVAGSIQAGRIRIHSSDDRATLAVENAQITAQDVAIRAGNARIESVVTEEVSQKQSSGKEARNVRVSTQNYKKTQQLHKTTINAENIAIGTTNKLDVNAAQIKGKNVTLMGGETHLGTKTTTNVSTAASQRSKGLWHRNEKDSSSVETLHRTEISADSLKLVSTQGKVTANAAKLNAKELGISGQSGVTLQGGKSTNHYSSEADFKLESARLRTGTSQQQATEQHYTATELNAQQFAVSSKGDIHFKGVKAAVDGNVGIQTQGKAIFTTEEVSNTHSVNDKEKFWGGLAGAKSLASQNNNHLQQGADVTVKGKLEVSADKGVQLSGSRVLASEGAVVRSEHGNLIIDSVKNTTYTSENSRTGTIFNITKARKDTFSKTVSSQGTSLKSESNLQLSADKNIDVIGSTVKATGLLDIEANKVNVKGAENYASSQTTEAGFGINAKVEKPTVTFDKDSFIATSIEEVKNLITGKTTFSKSLENVVNTAKEGVKFSATGSVSLDIYKNTASKESLTHTQSSLSGGKSQINAQNVVVAGSEIAATNGDLSILAKQIHTVDQKDRVTEAQKSTEASLKDQVTVTESSISNTLSATVTHQQSQQTTSTSQGSHLTATNDVNLTAERIRHVGSTLEAGHNIAQEANNIHQLAVHNQQSTTAKNVDVGLTLDTSIDKSKAISGSLSLSAEGGSENQFVSTAVGTTLQAGNDIQNNAQQRLDDVGTQYQVGNDLTLIAKQHQLSSSTSESHSTATSGGASISVEANSSDLQSVDAKVNAGVKFNHAQKDSETAQKASLSAGNNVSLQSNTLASQADISAKGKLDIQAQHATFTQSTNTASEQGGGFELNTAVGALVIPAAGVAVPSISVDAKANGYNKQSSEAVQSTLSANDVSVNGQKTLSVQGTNIQAKNTAVLSSNKLSVAASESEAHQVDMNANLGVSVGAKVSDVGLTTKLGVKHENSETHQGTAITAENVVLQGKNGVALSGVTVDAKQVTLESQGNVDLTAAQNNVKKTEVSTALSLKGGVAQGWTPSSGSASLDVSTTRNQTYTSTEVNANNAVLNANNANFIGSGINVDTLSGTVQGDSYTQTDSNKISETKVGLSANGSGKFTAYSSDKWQESVKKDWENGTIAGVKGEAQVQATAVRKNTNTQSGVNAKNNHLKVKGKTTYSRRPTNLHKEVTVDLNAHTNLKQDVENLKQHKLVRKPVVIVKNYK